MPQDTIESERLKLIPMNTSFITERYLAWLNDPEVYLFLETGGNYSMDDLRSYVNTAIEKKTLFWAIVQKDNGNHIGNIKIDPVNERHLTGEYGIMMGDKESWGKGFAHEATDALLKYCFQTLGLRKVLLGVVKDNDNAVKLYHRLGFITEGEFREHGFYNGKYCDTLRMAMFNAEFGK